MELWNCVVCLTLVNDLASFLMLITNDAPVYATFD